MPSIGPQVARMAAKANKPAAMSAAAVVSNASSDRVAGSVARIAKDAFEEKQRRAMIRQMKWDKSPLKPVVQGVRDLAGFTILVIGSVFDKSLRGIWTK